MFLFFSYFYVLFLCRSVCLCVLTYPLPQLLALLYFDCLITYVPFDFSLFYYYLLPTSSLSMWGGKWIRKLVDQFFLYLLTYSTSSHCLLFTFFPVWRRIVCLLTFLLPFFLLFFHLSEVLYYRLVVASFYLLTGYLHLVFSFLMNTSICNLPLLLCLCHCHCFCYTKHHISHIARRTSSEFSPGHFLFSSYPLAPCFSSSLFFLILLPSSYRVYGETLKA